MENIFHSDLQRNASKFISTVTENKKYKKIILMANEDAPVSIYLRHSFFRDHPFHSWQLEKETILVEFVNGTSLNLLMKAISEDSQLRIFGVSYQRPTKELLIQLGYMDTTEHPPIIEEEIKSNLLNEPKWQSSLVTIIENRKLTY
jgi:hypothetical protein